MSLEKALQGRATFHSRHIAEIDADIAHLGYDDENQIWHRANLFSKNITSRYTHSNHHISLYEYDLQELWYLIIQGTKITDANHPAQDRLAGQVARIQAMGVLSRDTNTAGEGSREIAVTSKGRIWVDLPFLVDEIRKAWVNDMPARQRRNMSAFTARLASWGICDPDLCLCAIWILRDALEIKRPLVVTSSNNQSDDVSCDPEKDKSVATLLPAAISWFEYCGYKLESLSIANQDYEHDSSAIGELAQAANVLPTSGFSLSRWRFWKSRLVSLIHSGETEVADLASRGHKIMGFWGERIEQIQQIGDTVQV